MPLIALHIRAGSQVLGTNNKLFNLMGKCSQGTEGLGVIPVLEEGQPRIQDFEEQ